MSGDANGRVSHFFLTRARFFFCSGAVRRGGLHSGVLVVQRRWLACFSAHSDFLALRSVSSFIGKDPDCVIKCSSVFFLKKKL